MFDYYDPFKVFKLLCRVNIKEMLKVKEEFFVLYIMLSILCYTVVGAKKTVALSRCRILPLKSVLLIYSQDKINLCSYLQFFHFHIAMWR